MLHSWSLDINWDKLISLLNKFSSIANTVSGSYPDAFIEKCDDLTKTCYITDAPSGKWANKLSLSDGKISKPIIEKYIEYFDHDLQNIPLNAAFP